MQAESNRQRFESVDVKTLADIKRVIGQFEPHARLNAKLDDVVLSADMTGTDPTNKSQKFHVSATTKTNSLRDVIIEGLNVVKRREDTATKTVDKAIPVLVDGKEMKPPSLIAEHNFMAIDPVITRTLGGYRHGHFVQWDLADGYTYRYDMFEHRLSRFKTEPKQ